MKNRVIGWMICVGLAGGAGWLRAETRGLPEGKGPGAENRFTEDTEGRARGPRDGEARRGPPPENRREQDERRDGRSGGRDGPPEERPEWSERGGEPGPGRAEALNMWLKGLEQRNPDEYQRLMRLREENPERFQAEVRKKLQALREERQKRFREDRDDRPLEGRPNPSDEFETSVRRNVRAWQEAGSDEERARLEAELREQLHNGLRRHLKAQEERLAALERQMQELRGDIERQREASEQVVDRRVRQMLQPGEGRSREKRERVPPRREAPEAPPGPPR